MITVASDVRGVCELLGLDPLNVACEGTCLTVVSPDAADAAVAALRKLPLSVDAAVIGHARPGTAHRVTIQRAGWEAPVDEPSGAMLPRICLSRIG